MIRRVHSAGSRCCHENVTQSAEGGGKKCGKRQQRKEKVSCWNLPQLADSVRLATPLARFGKVDRTASKQRVGGSSPSGRAIINPDDFEKLPCTPIPCEKKQFAAYRTASRSALTMSPSRTQLFLLQLLVCDRRRGRSVSAASRSANVSRFCQFS